MKHLSDNGLTKGLGVFTLKMNQTIYIEKYTMLTDKFCHCKIIVRFVNMPLTLQKEMTNMYFYVPSMSVYI